VAAVIHCNSISVAEHVVTMMTCLVRNYIPSHQGVVTGGWKDEPRGLVVGRPMDVASPSCAHHQMILIELGDHRLRRQLSASDPKL
jgi:lactate dehydrogenase-like 2-hydroxyacid dehydrogenase